VPAWAAARFEAVFRSVLKDQVEAQVGLNAVKAMGVVVRIFSLISSGTAGTAACSLVHWPACSSSWCGCVHTLRHASNMRHL